MQLTTGPPLLFAIGLRILLNYFNPDHTLTTSDYLLVGIWQGVLLHHSLKHLAWAVYPIGTCITAKLLYDFLETSDTSRCACTLLGIALGVLFTDILAQLFEYGRYDEHAPSMPTSQPSSPASHIPSRRLRLVSFDRSTSGAERDRRRRQRTPSPTRARARALAASPAPTTLTSYTIDSLPSSIDPNNRMTPIEREVAVLRARASLADSERRRFKEERKWALSQGNNARASQLAWQVKRYTALMESFHKEADMKLLDAAKAASATETRSAIAFPQSQAGPSRENAVAGPSRNTYVEVPSGQAGPSTATVSNGAPLVSVTVGTPSRTRKRSSNGAGALKPAIYLHNRQ